MPSTKMGIAKAMSFDNFKIDGPVFSLIGNLPKPTQECLRKAFLKIKSGKANMLTDSIIPNLLATEYCEFTILVSVTPDGKTAVIVDLHHQRNGLTDIL